MTFKDAICDCFEKSLVFKGRSSLFEFWYWMVFYMLGTSALFILDDMVFPAQVAANYYPMTLTFLAVTLIPGLAVGARRLHDTGRSGWWLLLLPTVVGYAALVYWWIMPGDTGSNAYGDPVAGREA